MSININNKEKKTYVVLGAPHSATSFIAKALEDQGVNMGSNMRDLHQDSSFVRANNNMLKEAGGWWNDPPSEEAIEELDVDDYIKFKIESASEGNQFWGFKDPRTSLTISKYLPHLEGDPYLVCVFRKPDRVVNSYDKSRGITKELIDRYNRSIIKAIEKFCEL